MKKHWRILLLIQLLSFPLSADSLQSQNLPQGEIVEKVLCQQNSSQTYALYLPANYTPGKQWPILYALDPGARGALPVKLFREAAEKYGFILAGSNNSRNGPVQIVQDAVNALFVDSRTRFSVDPRRMYVAGFSGGARAAVEVAAAMKGKMAGVLAFGAGFPPDMPPVAPMPFAIYLAVGDEDFNFPEMRELDSALGRLPSPRALEIFSGGHQWPPEDVCRHAVEWLELQAMKSGTREKDPQQIQQFYLEYLEEASLPKDERQLYLSMDRASSMLRSFAGLRDVTELDSVLKKWRQSEGIRLWQTREKEAETRQRNSDRELLGLFQNMLTGSDRQFASQRLHAGLDRLRTDADQKKSEVSRLAATRSLTSFWIMLNEKASAAIERREYGPAVSILELMARIRPDHPQIYYHLALVHSRNGKKKEAMGSLRTAVAKGFKDFALLESGQDFDILKKMPEYRKLVEDLKILSAR